MTVATGGLLYKPLSNLGTRFMRAASDQLPPMTVVKLRQAPAANATEKSSFAAK